MTTQASNFRNIAPAPELESRIAAAIAQEARNQESSSIDPNSQEKENMKTTAIAPSNGWTLRNGQSLRFAAVMLCAALIGVFLVSRKSPQSFAFADVENALTGISSAHWHSTVTQFDSSGKATFSEIDDNWATLDPAQYSRMDMAVPGRKFVEKEDGTESYNPKTKVVTEMKLPANRPISSVRDQIENLITLNDPNSIYISSPTSKGEQRIMMRTSLGDGEKQPDWSSKTVDENGHSITQFTRSIGMPDGDTVKQVVLVNPTTKLIERSSFEIRNSVGALTESGVNDQFHYNLTSSGDTLPPDTFVITPPPGAKIKVVKPVTIERRVTKDASGIVHDVTTKSP